jgi:hypothetical protein
MTVPKRKLQAVKGGTPPPKTPAKKTGGRPKTRLSSALDDDERTVLMILRRKYASMIDNSDARPPAMAALMKQFREVDAQIRAIDMRLTNAEVDDDDEDGDGDSGTDTAFDASTI